MKASEFLTQLNIPVSGHALAITARVKGSASLIHNGVVYPLLRGDRAYVEHENAVIEILGRINRCRVTAFLPRELSPIWRKMMAMAEETRIAEGRAKRKALRERKLMAAFKRLPRVPLESPAARWAHTINEAAANV